MVSEHPSKSRGKPALPDDLRRAIREEWRFTGSSLKDVAAKFSDQVAAARVKWYPHGKPSQLHFSAVSRIAIAYERDHGLDHTQKEIGPAI